MTDDVDAACRAALEAVTPEQWSALWEAVDALVDDTTFCTWEGGQVVDTHVVDGVERPVRQMPYPVYSEAVQQLRSTIGQLGLVVVFDWIGWEGVRRYAAGAGMADAPVEDAVRMITATMRAERFVDGAIDGKLGDGTLQAALGRIRRWCDDDGR